MVKYTYRNREPQKNNLKDLIQMATITVTDLATELDTDARTARKFLRSITPAEAQPGKGSRWSIEKREVRSLKSKFARFTAEAEAARKVREEPTEADLDAIEAEVDTDTEA